MRVKGGVKAYVVAPAKEVLGVHGPHGAEDPLHPLGVVHVATLTLIAAPDPDGTVLNAG